MSAGCTWRRMLLSGLVLLPAAPAAADGLKADAVAVEVPLPDGVPLAGFGDRRTWPDLLGLHPYAYYFEPSTGKRDGEEIRVKALLLQNADGELLFISTDLVGVSRDLREDLLAEIAAVGPGFSADELFLSATHTHSGPGALSDNAFFELGATDRFHSAVYAALLAALKDAVVQAAAGLEPASLFRYEFTASGLQKNRRQDPSYFDPTANVLLVQDAAGHWIGAMVNLAIHGTSLDETNLEYSADVAGAIERRFEEQLQADTGNAKAVPVLFVNGAEGDVIPVDSGPDWMNWIGAEFAVQAMAQIGARQPLAGTWTVAKSEVDIESAFLYYAPSSSAPNLPLWNQLGIDMHDDWFPEKTWIWSIELGDMRLMTWPGEPTTSLGLALREAAKSKGAQQSWVLGLTNDHLGYFTSPDDYALGGYEASGSMYGPHAGMALVNAHYCLLD